MARYIDVEAVQLQHGGNNSQRMMWNNIKRILEQAPTADVAPVVHGKWVMDTDPDDGDCRCSICHLCIDALHRRNHALLKILGYKLNTFYKFCPHCGALMDNPTATLRH